jgi:hypothetical protein
MSGPDEPQYPQYYGQQPPFAPPPPVPVRARLVDRFADRLAERPLPRVGVSLAGAGVALVIVGVLVWGFAYTVEGVFAHFDDESGPVSDSRHYLGGIVAVVVVAIGYALAIVARRGALATAGVAASALGVPVALAFLTLDVTGAGGSVVNSDLVVWGSIAVWLVSYLWVRGTQGHSFYLALTLYAFWAYVTDKAAPSALTRTVAAGSATFTGDSNLDGSGFDLGTVAGVSLAIGAIYYGIAWGLDRSGRRGAGVSFVLVGFLAVGAGIAALTPDLKQVGTGVVLLVVGVGLAAYGARYGRRFTTWAWAAGAGLGGALIMVKLVAGSGGPAIGISLMVLGAIFICGGALVARALNEPDDVVTAVVTAGDPA